MTKNILEFSPVRQVIESLGLGIEKYFGKDQACIVYLQPDGIFYAEGIYQWLLKKRKQVVITTMKDDGEGLDESKVRNKKILLVDNDVVTGAAYKRSMEVLKIRKARLGIKGIKFLAYIDRTGQADFSVWRYVPDAIWSIEKLDAKDLKIISLLGEDGRRPLASLALSVGLSQVAVKNRLAHLVQNKVLSVKGLLNAEHFYSLAAGIEIEAGSKTVEKLIEAFEQKQEVYHMRRRSGRYNLVVSILARKVEDVEAFVEKEIRSVEGVKELDVHIGELPIIPRLIPPKFTL